MGTLSRSETDSLRRVQQAIELVTREGYDPKATDEKNKNIRGILINARSVVSTVIDMKGYFPK